MDWGFTDVLNYNENTFQAACFAMVCHHCGQRCIVFPQHQAEKLFVDMIYAF